jgi:hypothetical protein
VNPDEREHMIELVLKIQQEKDHIKFTKLVEELNDLIAKKEHRFSPNLPPHS